VLLDSALVIATIAVAQRQNVELLRLGLFERTRIIPAAITQVNI